MQDKELDRTDQQILMALQEDGRMTLADLAEKVHLSASSCSRRVASLEQSGVIRGYHANVDPGWVGKSMTVFVEISLTEQTEPAMDAFELAVSHCPDVLDCYLTAGDADYLLRLAVQDINDFQNIHRKQLARLPGIAKMRTSFTLRTVVERKQLPLG